MKRKWSTDEETSTWTLTFEAETVADKAEHVSIDQSQPATVTINGKLTITGKLLTTPLPRPTTDRPKDEVRDNQ